MLIAQSLRNPKRGRGIVPTIGEETMKTWLTAGKTKNHLAPEEGRGQKPYAESALRMNLESLNLRIDLSSQESRLHTSSTRLSCSNDTPTKRDVSVLNLRIDLPSRESRPNTSSTRLHCSNATLKKKNVSGRTVEQSTLK